MDRLRPSSRACSTSGPRVAEASRRYSTASGESELKSLEESFGANLTRMRRYGEQEALSHREAQSWSDQAAEVRSRGQGHRPGVGPALLQVAHGPRRRRRARGRRGGRHAACTAPDPGGRRGSPGARRGLHRGNGSRRPGPPGPGVGAGTLADYGRTREGLSRVPQKRDHGGLGGMVGAGPGTTDAEAMTGEAVGKGAERLRAEADTELDIREAEREARGGLAGERNDRGRARVAAETDRPFGEHAAEAVSAGGRVGSAASSTARRGTRRRTRAGTRNGYAGGPDGPGRSCSDRDGHGRRNP